MVCLVVIIMFIEWRNSAGDFTISPPTSITTPMSYSKQLFSKHKSSYAKVIAYEEPAYFSRKIGIWRSQDNWDICFCYVCPEHVVRYWKERRLFDENKGQKTTWHIWQWATPQARTWNVSLPIMIQVIITASSCKKRDNLCHVNQDLHRRSDAPIDHLAYLTRKMTTELFPGGEAAWQKNTLLMTVTKMSGELYWCNPRSLYAFWFILCYLWNILLRAQ